MVAEYLNYKMLSKLGFDSDFKGLTAYKVEIFAVISNEFTRLETQELKKRQKKR